MSKTKTPEKKMSFTDIKDHTIACKVLGIDPKERLDFSSRPESEREAEGARTILQDVADAIRKVQGYKRLKAGDDYWIPAFNRTRGFAFDFSYCDDWFSGSYVVSRLSYRFKSEEEATFFGEHFNDQHKIDLNS